MLVEENKKRYYKETFQKSKKLERNPYKFRRATRSKERKSFTKLARRS